MGNRRVGISSDCHPILSDGFVKLVLFDQHPTQLDSRLRIPGVSSNCRLILPAGIIQVRGLTIQVTKPDICVRVIRV